MSQNKRNDQAQHANQAWHENKEREKYQADQAEWNAANAQDQNPNRQNPKNPSQQNPSQHPNQPNRDPNRQGQISTES